jgi:hypothetical protein
LNIPLIAADGLTLAAVHPLRNSYRYRYLARDLVNVKTGFLWGSGYELEAHESRKVNVRKT